MKKSLMWLIWAIVYFVVTVVTVAAIFQGLVTFPVIVLIIISMMLSMWIIKAIPDEQKEKKQNQRRANDTAVVSVEHEAGKKLQNLGGTAAPPRYPTT